MRIKDQTFFQLTDPNRPPLRLSAVPTSPYYDPILKLYIGGVFCNTTKLRHCLEFDEKAGWARCIMFDTSGRATTHAVEYRGKISFFVRQPTLKEIQYANGQRAITLLP